MKHSARSFRWPLVGLVGLIVLATGVLTVVSSRRSILLPGVTFGQTHCRLAIEHGGIGLRVVSPNNTGIETEVWEPEPRAWPSYSVRNFVLELSANRPNGPHVGRYANLALPAWTIGLALIMIVIWHAHRNSSRQDGSLCVCGYDLNGLPGPRCPECGRG